MFPFKWKKEEGKRRERGKGKRKKKGEGKKEGQEYSTIVLISCKAGMQE